MSRLKNKVWEVKDTVNHFTMTTNKMQKYCKQIGISYKTASVRANKNKLVANRYLITNREVD